MTKKKQKNECKLSKTKQTQKKRNRHNTESQHKATVDEARHLTLKCVSYIHNGRVEKNLKQNKIDFLNEIKINNHLVKC